MKGKTMAWCEKLLVMLTLVMVFAAVAVMPGHCQALQSLPTVSGTSVDAPSLDLYPLGKSFGKAGAFQFGIDKSATAGVCGGYDIPDHIFLAGPCRDLLVMAHAGKPVAHLGGFVGYGLADINRSHPYWSGRAGINTGGFLSAGLSKLADDVPYFDALSAYQAPAWVSYAGKITTLDYFVGYNGHWVHGPGLKADIPLADLLALITAAGGK
jgi:hypothetical protein